MSSNMSAKKKPTPLVVSTPQPEDAKQEQLLNEAKHMVSVQAFQMKRALDGNCLTDALKHASHLISELRTGQLWPKTYYALYIFTVDQLRHLEFYISEGGHGRSLHELYEMIQCAGNILPRLYLMVTVGSVFIKKLAAPAKDLLVDMVELCRGVQHPTRGLFLRTYLSEMTKDKLPDEGSKYDGDITDAINFILINFTEMNKLWVRMQHGISNLGKREQEREELNVLVGKNLSRLSQLDGLTMELYKDYVLPKILVQVVQCKDRIAQQYLMVIIIQAFSDEFHLRTLPQLLETCSKLEDDVNVQAIIASLLDRVSSYCMSQSVLPHDINMFDLFKNYIEDLVKKRENMPLEASLGIANALIAFSLKCYKDNLEYVDIIFEIIRTNIQEKNLSAESKEAIQQTLKILQTPLAHFKSPRPVLQLKNYTEVLNFLPFKERRDMALYIIDILIQNNVRLPSAEEVTKILEYLSPLIKRSVDTDGLSDEDWHNDQVKVACVINTFYTKDVGNMYDILTKAKEFFADCPKTNVTYVMVPLVYKALQLVQAIYKQKSNDKEWEKKSKLVCKYANDLVSLIRTAIPAVNNSAYTLTAFHLYLQCALQSGKCGLSKFAYGFLTHGALTLYEDEGLSQSSHDYDSIRQLIAVVQVLECFDAESYEKLAKRIAQHSSKLTIVENQCRATTMSAHLFLSVLENGEPFRDTKSSLSCLKKAGTVAQNLTEPDLKAVVFVELLDQFIYFFNKQPDVMVQSTINSLIEKVVKYLSDENIPPLHACRSHFSNIVEFVQSRHHWENLAKKEKPKKEVTPEGIEVEGDVGLSDPEAKKEAARWKEIQFKE